MGDIEDKIMQKSGMGYGVLVDEDYPVVYPDIRNEFVTCQISIVVNNTQEMYEDMGMRAPSERNVDFRFDPDAVIAYRADPPTDEHSEEGVVFSLPNDEYYTEMTVKEFENLIGV